MSLFSPSLHYFLDLLSSFKLVNTNAAAAQVFNLTANNLFDRDGILHNYRINHARRRRSFGHGACSRYGLHDKVHADNSTHPNSPYGTRSKSSSTPNLSTLRRFISPTRKGAKYWCPPSPIPPIIRSNSPTATTTGGEWTSARETRDLSVSVHVGGLQR